MLPVFWLLRLIYDSYGTQSHVRMSATDSISSSEPSPRQQDDVPWAKPEEFEANKGIITHLYDLSGRNLTLKETMRIMEVSCPIKRLTS